MPLKAVVESLDEIDEALRPHYVEDEKLGFRLAIERLDDHPEVRPVVTANRENKREKETIRKKLEAAEARLGGLPEDFTAEAWEELKARAEAQGDDGKLEAAKQFAAEHLARTKAQYEAEIAKITRERDEERAAREKMIVEGGLHDALIEAGADPDLLGGAMALLAPKIVVRREDNEVRAIVETDLGEQSVKEFVESWSQGKVGVRYMTKPEGPDARGSQRHAAMIDNPFTAKAWNKTSQAKVDPARREQLAKAAGFPDYATAIRATRPMGSVAAV